MFQAAQESDNSNNLPIAPILPKRYPSIRIFYIAILVMVIGILILGGVSLYLHMKIASSLLIENKVHQKLDVFGFPVGDQCYVNYRKFKTGEVNPQNECQKCDPAVTPVNWVSQNDGISCFKDQGVCSKGSCIPKIKPMSMPNTATDSSGFSSKPAAK